MGTGYIRQSSATIVTGQDIIAAPLNAEFNAIVAAFDATTGHLHDGTTGNGPKLDLSVSSTGNLPVNRGGTGAAVAATALSNLGGQPLNSNLTALSGLTGAADTGFYFTGAGLMATTSLTATGRSIIAGANVAAVQTTLSLVPGTNVQAYHARLADIAGITYAQGDILYYNGTNIVKLAAGTSGNVLQTNGAAANPTWVSPTSVTGLLVAANNLSDVSNKQTSHDNLFVSQQTVASAATLNLDTAGSEIVEISGTTTTTAITLTAGRVRLVRAQGAWPITGGGSLILNNNSGSYTCAAGDCILFIGYAAGVVRGLIFPINGQPTVTVSVANGGTGITSFGSGIATWLGTPNSANLAAAMTDETGTGALVFANTPTLVTPVLGVATATTINGNTFTTGTYTLTGTAGKTLNFTNTLTFSGTDGTTMTFPSTSSTVLTVGNNATITKGYYVTPNSIGTISTGTVTPDAANGNYQYYTNNGAHTYAAPSTDCAMDVMIINGASAGAITFSGFTVSANVGDALTTTNTNKFIISVRRMNAVSTYTIKAL